MQKSKIYPKVLVVSESPLSLDNGFGVTLHNLFNKWPQEKIGVFYTHKYIQHQTLGQRCVFQRHSHIHWHHGRRYALPMLVGIKPSWRNRYSLLWLKRNLGRYKPSLVYTLFHSEATLHFGSWIARRLKIPHVIHAADDGLSLSQQTQEDIHSSSARYVISNLMAEEYRRRYNTSFQVLHNVAPKEYYQAASPIHQSPAYREKVSMTMRYLGRMHSWLHYDSIKLLDAAIDKCSENSIHWNLEIYGSADEDSLRSSQIINQNVTYHGPVSREQGIKLLHSSDLLVIPLTYNKDILHFYKFSFPAKLTEYLATGVPILLLSDQSAASTLFCQSYSVAHCITSPNVDLIQKYLTRIWEDPSEGIAQGARNVTLARSKFDKSAITATFQASLCSVVSRNLQNIYH